MKKILFLSLFTALMMLCVSNTNAQYHITSHDAEIGSVIVGGGYPCIIDDTARDVPYYMLRTNAYSPSLTVHSYYGDGTSDITSLTDSAGYGIDYYSSPFYQYSGVYTIKQVLYDGTTPVDSCKFEFLYLACDNKYVGYFYYDSVNTCVYDTLSDVIINVPIKYEVDSNGIAVDTVSQFCSGFSHAESKNVGDIYAYKFINTGVAGLEVSCPASGIVYDTIKSAGVPYSPINMGFRYPTSGTGFDLSAYANLITGRHRAKGTIVVTNSFGTPIYTTVTMNISPKYIFENSSPAPTSVIGNTVTWDLSSVSAHSSVLTKAIQFELTIPSSSSWLTPGDTVQSNFTITPTVGDINPLNNNIFIVDTVKSSFDPNEMSVTPGGYISSGTQLQYTIGFENTGNDTAFNISVLDTLSPNVDPRTFHIITASAVVNPGVYNRSGYNIVKFDFPNINLLDSSHHGQCDGMVMFTVNAKNGLPDGTTIFNHAGIFFDYNPVVMTDTVENIIGFPAAVAAVSKSLNVAVYPNPANNEVTIQADNSSYNTATFTNVVGQQLMTAELSPTQTKVNVSKLPSGMYYITLSGAAGVKVMKFEKL